MVVTLLNILLCKKHTTYLHTDRQLIQLLIPAISYEHVYEAF